MAFVFTVPWILAPFALALLAANELHRAINPAVVSKSFVRRQFMYSFFVLPFIDIFARVWLLQPFVPLLALLVAALIAASATMLWLFRYARLIANHTVVLSSSVNRVLDYARAELFSPQLEHKCQHLTHSTQALFSNLNYTQLRKTFELAYHQYNVRTDEMGTHAGLQQLELWSNFSRFPVIMQVRNNVSSILNNFLHAIQFTDFVPNPEWFHREKLIFDDLKQNLISIFHRISLEPSSSMEELEDAVFYLKTRLPLVQHQIQDLRLSLASTTPQIVSHAALPSEEAERTLDELLKLISGSSSLSDAFTSLFLSPSSETKQVYQMCDAYDFLRIDPRWIASLLVLMFMSVPFMYIGRTLLQSLIQWQLSKTYRDVGGETERKIDGYVLTGGVTGIGFGAAQATVQVLLWGFAPFSARSKLVLLVHCAMLMVIHCVTQMAINSAEGRQDLMIRWNGRKGWWILTTLVHVVAGMWWTAQYVGTLIFAAWQVHLILNYMLVGDAVVLALFLSWGRSICRRARVHALCHAGCE